MYSAVKITSSAAPTLFPSFFTGRFTARAALRETFPTRQLNRTEPVWLATAKTPLVFPIITEMTARCPLERKSSDTLRFAPGDVLPIGDGSGCGGLFDAARHR